MVMHRQALVQLAHGLLPCAPHCITITCSVMSLVRDALIPSIWHGVHTSAPFHASMHTAPTLPNGKPMVFRRVAPDHNLYPALALPMCPCVHTSCHQPCMHTRCHHPRVQLGACCPILLHNHDLHGALIIMCTRPHHVPMRTNLITNPSPCMHALRRPHPPSRSARAWSSATRSPAASRS